MHVCRSAKGAAWGQLTAQNRITYHTAPNLLSLWVVVVGVCIYMYIYTHTIHIYLLWYTETDRASEQVKKVTGWVLGV